MAEKIQAFYGEVRPTLENVFRRTVNNSSTDTGALLDALLKDTELDMARFASIDATNTMQAYCRVAPKDMVDSFGMYPMEQCLLNELPEPFKPAIVFALDDAMVTRIAGNLQSQLLNSKS
ncbi:uncharacterized protein Z519_05051 [Cladophialophora bantiana CBS 173.52]|uniref:Uncharacterized protein n=1 Tax=Cladophialophora bantiana (strain ATCC 10958 / CBS 173.52 / CDC B-1940 / NIH 8579) TaxID=1442370 RepID=A0A0D2EV52_CLAB1|nr:uncharacterized protein Z519_05051 [Cladophialophora bantiana CBS 173.52]KIW93736.1 hypothetical protein Z519_05051 [Cladophialophora bantiana CBS 173.52]